MHPPPAYRALLLSSVATAVKPTHPFIPTVLAAAVDSEWQEVAAPLPVLVPEALAW